MVLHSNLFENISDFKGKESLWEIVKNESVRVERIVSQGQASPPGFWYDQDEHEWVAVLTGQVILQIEGQENDMALGPGDTVLLPARTRHRVEWTDPLHPTIWLAVFWRS